MTDDERDARIDTLIDAIADTNRNVNALTANMAKLTNVMDLHLRHDHGFGSDEDD